MDVARYLAAAGDAPGPALIFDLGVIATRMEAARAVARAAGVGLLFAAKSFPVAEVLALATARLDGLDLAGPEEQVAAMTAAPTAVSVTYPGGVDAATIAALAQRHRVTVVCETAAQVATAAALAGVRIAVRLSASALLDEDAPGGVRDADGGHASRFGAAPAELAAVIAAGGGRVRGLHVHGGPLATAPARLARLAAAAVAAAAAVDLPLEHLDLGGSLHGFALTTPAAGTATLAAGLAAARAAVPAAVELVFEPGRLYTERAGFAAGTVVAARALAGRAARVLDLSRLCHLRWSTPRLCAPAPRPGERAALVLLGATCCEDDVIAEALVRPGEIPAVGDRVLLAGINGYAAAWNRGFAGVPAARLVLVGPGGAAGRGRRGMR